MKATVDLLRKLVGFDTTSSDSNLNLIEFIDGFLATRGLKSRKVLSADGNKSNLWVTIGPDRPSGVVLSGHTDCVPVDGQDWMADPFVLRETADRFVGRGTSDMKTFVASSLAAVDGWLAADLSVPIHLALSYDEETGGDGARLLLADMDNADLGPAFCVVGEPTSMQVVTSHKGVYTFRVAVAGREAHSSLAPRAVNAVQYAAEMITRLTAVAAQRRADGPRDEGFDVPYTTVHTGTIRGGVALNIVPKDCHFEFEYRHLPTDSPEVLHDIVVGLAAEVEATMPDEPGVGISITARPGLPCLNTPTSDAVVATVGALAGDTGTSKVAYGTEAGMFAEVLDTPTVVCGPGSILQAHKPEEFILKSQVEACDRFMVALGESVSS